MPWMTLFEAIHDNTLRTGGTCDSKHQAEVLARTLKMQGPVARAFIVEVEEVK